MSDQMVIIVTGANRGIGLAICQTLLSHTPNAITLYACSRKGLDLNLSPSNSSSTTSKHTIHYPSLDITSSSSIQSLAETISSRHNHASILINNAGITDLNTSFSAADVMNVNYTGTKNMCLAFLPLLSENPRGGSGSKSRIVNLSSTASSLSSYSQSLQASFRDPSLTLPQLDDLANSFLEASQASGASGAAGNTDASRASGGNGASSANEAALKKAGWGPTNAYPPSKACVNALTAILARENQGVAVNCCCPGWVDTEMGGAMGRAPKTAKEGARIPVGLAVGDLEGVSGGYWGNNSVMEKGKGKRQRW